MEQEKELNERIHYWLSYESLPAKKRKLQTFSIDRQMLNQVRENVIHNNETLSLLLSDLWARISLLDDRVIELFEFYVVCVKFLLCHFGLVNEKEFLLDETEYPLFNLEQFKINKMFDTFEFIQKVTLICNNQYPKKKRNVNMDGFIYNWINTKYEVTQMYKSDLIDNLEKEKKVEFNGRFAKLSKLEMIDYMVKSSYWEAASISISILPKLFQLTYHPIKPESAFQDTIILF